MYTMQPHISVEVFFKHKINLKDRRALAKLIAYLLFCVIEFLVGQEQGNINNVAKNKTSYTKFYHLCGFLHL
jgi:hypothetical protein